MSNHTFYLLHHDIQETIYNMGWLSLHKIQSETIQALHNKPEQNIIISAPTAGGKTEAAFLPTISLTRDELEYTLPILYISPLKALINDQFERVEELCKNLDIKITKWHGDASQTKKTKLLKSPSGILLITPESLESLLINHEKQTRNMFANLKYIIIDEVHSFVGEVRGDHLKSLINRIEILNNIKCSKIALSATVGSPEKTKLWLNDPDALLIEDNDNETEIRGAINYFEQPEDLLDHLADISQKSKNLFFANAKKTLEEDFVGLHSRHPEISHIGIHHGSLSKEQREHVELSLKKESLFSVFCTNTLELGIDIGNIETVVLLDPPWSESSFVQKIGRSGRTPGTPIKFQFYLVKEPEKVPKPPFQSIHWNIIESIALVELLKEHWVEPGTYPLTGYSTLVHQVLAYIAQKRQVAAGELYEVINVKSFNNLLSIPEFGNLLRHLGSLELIRQNANEQITLDERGEKLTESYKFLAVFQTPEEWTVKTAAGQIGTIPLTNNYKINDKLLLGGKVWNIEDIDYKNHVLFVVKAIKGAVPNFSDSFGIKHKMIHQKMKEIIEGTDDYNYLTDNVKEILNEDRRIYKLPSTMTNIYPLYQGTKIGQTLFLLIKSIDPTATFFDFAIQTKVNISSLKPYVDQIDQIIDEEITKVAQHTFIEKFDNLLPLELRKSALIRLFYDIDGAKNFLRSL